MFLLDFFHCVVGRAAVQYTTEFRRRHVMTSSQYMFCIGSSNRSYFTNTDVMKKTDPYAALGLTWGATATEIKEAYRRLARELHPDVSKLDPTKALNEFRLVKDAYDKLMNNKNSQHGTDLWEEWSFAIWRSGDLIAQERTDVAGVMKKRPIKPAESHKKGRGWGVSQLGHPDGRGRTGRRAEYIGESTDGMRKSATVGTGQSKWVEKKEFRPWNPEDNKMTKGVSQQRRPVMNSARKNGDIWTKYQRH
ncbi:predicted protein [Thalassiosira pseudonana CCMP1335]|uniref:J domain-containing protein n=1 Tax=Thalassiosira pseudonana TaxID=35128 RepID=B8LBZ0_THAPS|nr:predicted protein [Thalassiosira pseudonana CCMP1335]EED87269.1 predicted protein [Thalassiosira pseudonana CCMP1335]